MKNRFFPVKQVTTGNRNGWSWRSMRLLILCGMGVLTSLTVVLSGTSVAQMPQPTKTVAQPVQLFAQAPETEALGIPPRDEATDTTDVGAEKPDLGPTNKYILEFNRSPAIGNRYRMNGVYGESRLGFTRPRNWQVKGVKAIVRFQHSPDLVASRSNLIVRVNDTSIGAIPLNLKEAQIGEAIVTIPANLIQDYNELTLVAQQENSATCSEPGDEKLWTEVLPDSKLVFDYQSKIVPLDFGRFPYPFFDELTLDTTRINYLQPTQTDKAWLTATSRFQSQLGRLADFRNLETQLIKAPKNLSWNDRLVIVGTPAQQPLLKTLKLPLKVKGNEFIGNDAVSIPADEGLLMLTNIEDGKVPVLVISGNSPEAVQKAAQFLVQDQSTKLGTSALIQVKGELNAPTPAAQRAWPRFLPPEANFKLSQMQRADGKTYSDVTVRGSDAPPVEINFWAMPDDRFLRGSTMNLKYSYSAQTDPTKSTVSVAIDGVNVGSKKLDSDQGGSNESFNVDLPANLIKPNSTIRVNFKLIPQGEDSVRACGRLTDQQLWGTVLGDTSFSVKREIGADLPNLKLLTTGYPFAEWQSLSRMAIVLPESPNPADIMTLIKFSERMGRLTRAESIEHQVYLGDSELDETVKSDKHIVAIGTSNRLPLPDEVFKQGLGLLDNFNRQFKKTQTRSLPNADGVIKMVNSPWGKERVILALTAQTDKGLKQVQDVLSADPWFYQLQGDTALMTPTSANPSPYDPNGYQFQFLQEATPRTLEKLNPLNKVRRFLEQRYYLISIGVVGVALLMYGIAQRYLKRVSEGK
ncbi:cellulose biosynthesis cyclic di-GMP-binding regulatory protein BcsB [filamentous cyanobacterium LEGE 11480]|uniref:Cellulose biosynthesis cyclic di-GMP-binding regulatory protein BcsB n=1 Tax=Romeriopsis navalis LEGE 11480 TaxID=2777977 RepID=A0A928VMP3_9CYAN|nr:cellulose biosynthesis cyclic di-GMP-binding regulatory protein BcsB [Romeriopsis navalis]MBE9031140.1 cellulose biosynthesis cyclic di-GMP-binding regulatory protein BcsB [Romeriopsis navalis LEGE 11480]